MNERFAPARAHERGSIMVLAAGLLLTLTGFAVLAADVGRIYIVRNEMQNVVDAAALAGANCLTRQSSPTSTTDCIAALGTGLNWTRAAAKAEAQLSANSADNLAMSSTDAGHTVEVGYYNLLSGQPSGGTFNTGFAPITVNDKPAVRVTLRKEAGVNNGPIRMITRLMFGSGADVPMYAQAVAVISSPSLVLPSTVIPQAINKCMYDQFWDSTTGQPVIYTGTPADPYGISTIGQPWRVRIGSAYHYGTCASGQWTTFDLDVNSQSAVGTLIANGNPTSLGIGDMTWIEPGTKTASYNDLDAKYPTPPGADVAVLVVDTTDLSSKGQAPIVAFAGFHIDDIQGGSGKYIEGHFIPSMVSTGGSGIGPFYGTYTPPRLAR
jgi:Flp pilus assembly protein TadG